MRSQWRAGRDPRAHEAIASRSGLRREVVCPLRADCGLRSSRPAPAVLARRRNFPLPAIGEDPRLTLGAEYSATTSAARYWRPARNGGRRSPRQSSIVKSSVSRNPALRRLAAANAITERNRRAHSAKLLFRHSLDGSCGRRFGESDAARRRICESVSHLLAARPHTFLQARSIPVANASEHARSLTGVRSAWIVIQGLCTRKGKS